MKKRLLTYVLIVGFFLCTAIYADTELTDTQKNATATNLGLYGSYTWDLAVDPTDNSYIYLAAYYAPNGFYRSSDGGLTWEGLPANSDHGAGREVEVNPDNGHVYALLNDLLVSTDNGDTYTVAYEFGSNGWSLLYAQDTLFVSTSNGEVYRSTDEGANFSTAIVCDGQAVWSLASVGDSILALCYDYNSDESTLYESIDGGATWTDLEIANDGVSGAVNVAVNPVNDYIYLLPPSTGGDTYRSIDGGSTWTTLTDPPITSHMNFNSTGRIYVGWFYSDDNGDTWTGFGDGGSYNHIMMPDPTDDNILYNTSVPGFRKSEDGGTTWTDSVEGILGAEVTFISQATDKNIVWVATQNGPAMTEDFLSDAPTWQYMPTSQNYISSSYDAVWVNPDDTNYVVSSSSQSLQYSTDGGLTWANSTVDITLTGAVFQIISDMYNILYAVVGPNVSTGSPTGGVIISFDNGATWTSLGFPDDSAARSIAVASDADLFVGAHSTLGGMYKYDGREWTKLDAPDEHEYVAITVDPEDADTIYAVAKTGGVYKSSDDGATWEEKNTGLGDIDEEFIEFNAIAIHTVSNPATIYLSAVKSSTLKGVVYKSSDGAENWSKLYTGKSGETFNVLLFDGLVAGNTRGVYNMKSRADITLKRAGATLMIKLRDAATERRLKHKTIKLYKKKNQEWHYWKKVKTNNKGNKSLIINFTRTTNLKALWKPAGHFADEYTKAVETKKIKI
jgi:photosystem II stability/assembly factor-like uncharacterized protein